MLRKEIDQLPQLPMCLLELPTAFGRPALDGNSRYATGCKVFDQLRFLSGLGC